MSETSAAKPDADRKPVIVPRWIVRTIWIAPPRRLHGHARPVRPAALDGHAVGDAPA